MTDSTAGSAVISNGTVTLGVRDLGDLNYAGVGLLYLPTGGEVLNVGCLCEGWGAADAISGVQGWASVAFGTSNVALVSFTSTATTATSIVTVGGKLRVTHNYRPSPATPFLYEIAVTIENISGAPVNLRYSRDMDWDVPPTPFNEFVTIQGTAAEPTILYADNNGFQTPGPLIGRSHMGAVGDFVDFGPQDRGALFDFGFGVLAAGASRQFTIFYGAAGTEANALAAIAAVGATVYSLGQPNITGGPDLGTPNTFMFAYQRAIEVPVDIRPTSCPNPLNTQEQGVLPAAILGTATFDVTRIDPATVRLAGVSPLRWALEDVATPFLPFRGKTSCTTDCSPLGGDGVLDLTLHFDARAVVAALGALADGQCVVVKLTGNLKPEFGGTPIMGEDVVTIIKKR